MARRRNAAGRTVRPAEGSAGDGARPDGRVKLTAYITADLRRRLKHLAVDEGQDVGRLIEPALWSLIGKRYERHRPAERRAPDDGDGEAPAVRLADEAAVVPDAA